MPALFISVLWTVLVLISLSTVAQEPSLPTLPTRFSAIIEANLLERNQTWIVEEYFDSKANKAKRIFFHRDIISVTYEDFSDAKDQLWSYQTTHQDTSNALSCTLESYKEHRRPWRNEETNSGNLISSAEWFQFGANYSEIYLGSNFVVRGIFAEAWTRNVTRSNDFGGSARNDTYTLTFFFALESWDWFSSTQHRVPIRVELTGTSVSDNGTFVDTSTFHHYYDYIEFLGEDLMQQEGLDFDIPEFYEQCNVTSYCQVYTNNHICSITKGPPLPKVPYSFSTMWEWSSFDDAFVVAQQTSLVDLYYDYQNDRAHSVWRVLDGYDTNAIHYLELLGEEDGRQVWTWMGEEDIRNCNMVGADTGYTGYQYGLPVMNGTLLAPGRLFWFNDKVDSELGNETWMGYTTIRGVAAEKWKATLNVTVNGGESTIWLMVALPSNQQVKMYGDIIWYFSSANWTFAYDVNDTVIPLAFSITGAYEVYNYSDTLNGYELVDTMRLNEFAHVFQWLSGSPDESWFKPPAYWRKECAIDSAYCDESDEEICDEGLDLPTLPQHKYSAVVEGTDAVNQTTHIIKTWYNYDENEYRNEYYNGNVVVVTYDDLNEDRRWTWVRYVNDTENMISCDVVPFESTIKAGNERFSEKVDTLQGPHVKTASDLWRFGKDWNVTYLGTGFSVRGIGARAWHTASNTSYMMNGTANKISFESVFYFAENWDYYKAVETSDIPLKVDINGVYEIGGKTKVFNTQFHVVSFFSGPQAFDESEMKDVFDDWSSQCNVSLYCDAYSDANICKSNEKTVSTPQKQESSNTVFYVMMPVLFVLGLFIGFLVDRWFVRRKGYAAFRNEAAETAADGL